MQSSKPTRNTTQKFLTGSDSHSLFLERISIHQCRSGAIDIWKDAMQEGWVSDNIPAKTRDVTKGYMDSKINGTRACHRATPRRYCRDGIKIRKDATAWAEDVALCVIQQKTGNEVRIPLDIGICGFTVGGVIKSCRDNIVSRWMIHHQRPRTLSKPGDQVWIDTITRRFAEARDLAGVKGEEGKQPSLLSRDSLPIYSALRRSLRCRNCPINRRT